MLTLDSLIAMHKVCVDTISEMTDSLDSLEAGPPADDAALAAALTDLATGIRNLAVVQRDLLAAMLGKN